MQISHEANGIGGGTLMLHLLGRCNLVCRHCYMEGAPNRPERLPLQDVVNAISECPALGINTLYITGGEPLLYPGLKQLLAAASNVGGLQITVCTNATLLTQRRAELLGALGVRVNVSVDGEPEFHDYFRDKPGAFAASERGVNAAVAAGSKVTIVSTISQGNLHSVPALVDWAISCRVETFRVQPLLKLGRGDAIADQRLTPEQTDLLILQISDLANRHRSVLRCGLIGLSRRYLQAHPCGAYVCNGAGCHRRVAKEIKKIVVREDGTVLPEITNLSHEYALGKLGEAPLGTLVDRFFCDGYDRFDQLCRMTYAEIIPDWPAAIVPWDQIVAERSRSWRPSTGFPRPSPTEWNMCTAVQPTSPMH
jgi:MoaA/NifB/PqqE/SkfB family radical SAM enzyme